MKIDVGYPLIRALSVYELSVFVPVCVWFCVCVCFILNSVSELNETDIGHYEEIFVL